MVSAPSGRKQLKCLIMLLNERVTCSSIYWLAFALFSVPSSSIHPPSYRYCEHRHQPRVLDVCAVGSTSSGSSQHLLPVSHPGPTMPSVVSILRPLRPTVYSLLVFQLSIHPLLSSRPLPSAAPYSLHATFNLVSSLAPLFQHPHLPQCSTINAFSTEEKDLACNATQGSPFTTAV